MTKKYDVIPMDWVKDKNVVTTQANAEHISKCVNLHDELVEALETLLNAALRPEPRLDDTILKAIDLAYAVLEKNSQQKGQSDD